MSRVGAPVKPGPNDPCVCGSATKFKRCCSPILDGQLAATPEALMRSRYSAYALGNADHIIVTTSPNGPHWQHERDAWHAEITAFCRDTTFERLEVLDARADGNKGIVAFRAHLSGSQGTTVLAERSAFQRLHGRWLYHAGSRLDESSTPA